MPRADVQHLILCSRILTRWAMLSLTANESALQATWLLSGRAGLHRVLIQGCPDSLP